MLPFGKGGISELAMVSTSPNVCRILASSLERSLRSEASSSRRLDEVAFGIADIFWTRVTALGKYYPAMPSTGLNRHAQHVDDATPTSLTNRCSEPQIRDNLNQIRNGRRRT